MTLIELMTVLAVMAVSLALVSPSISAYLEDRKIRNVAESFVLGMQKTRLNAVQRNIPTQFEWSGHQWTVSELDTTKTPPEAITPALETLDWGTNGTSVTVTRTPAGTRAIVTFDGLGKVLPTNLTRNSGAPPGMFAVSSSRPGSKTFRVTINVGGGIRMCDPQFIYPADPKGC